MMYKKTKKYRELIKRVKNIQKHFVAAFIDKDVMELNEREMDLCRGYKMLCHAEIEYYFEEIAKIILKESLWNWQSDRKVTLPIAGLLANYEKIDTNDSISTKINKIASDYSKMLSKSNHGIKEENLKKIFGNLGVNVSELDAIWVATLASYGSSRGTIAHTSAIVQTPINIKETIIETESILDGIENFEIELINQTKIDLYKAEKRQMTHI
ncbi:MAG: HEPN domain-containing protein [Ruminococcus flavefaciens]|nr:HEPN domain-containing protein [Ruminococcus flavefaciens]